MALLPDCDSSKACDDRPPIIRKTIDRYFISVVQSFDPRKRINRSLALVRMSANNYRWHAADQLRRFSLEAHETQRPRSNSREIGNSRVTRDEANNDQGAAV